jgi:MFS superfamily sulfate permease-like transporter
MTGTEFIGIVGSPAGLMLAAQLATLLIVIAGFCIMFGWRRLAKRLMVLAVVIIVIPYLIMANHEQINSIIESTPRWVLAPLLALGCIIVFCWALWGMIALCFGPRIASTVTADILGWLLKGTILAVVAPYRASRPSYEG